MSSLIGLKMLLSIMGCDGYMVVVIKSEFIGQQLLEQKKGIIRTILNGISASFVGIAGGASAMYDIGFEGDVIDFTNSKVVTAEKFAKKYRIVSED